MKKSLASLTNIFLGRSFLRFLDGVRKIEFISNDRKRKWVFYIGLVVFLLYRVNIVAVPIAERDSPVEPDDAYSYIVKAAAMEDCLFQQCTALEDLQTQFLTPSNELPLANERLRQYFRIFENYHPLHSAVLVALHSQGLSLEDAFNVTVILGSIFLVISIAYWLLSTWGPGGAGITLIGLSFVVFKGQGLHSIVPSNLSLGIAMLSWALIIQKSKRLNIVLPLSVMLMISMHRIGFIYAIFSMTFYVLSEKELLTRRTLKVLGISLLILLGYFVIQQFTTVPELFFSPDIFYPDPWNPIDALRSNLKIGLESITIFWGEPTWIKLLIGTLSFVGFISLPDAKRRFALKLGTGLFLMFMGSLIYVTPTFHGVLTRRVWIPFAFFLSGSVGRAMWVWLTSIILVFRNLQIRRGFDFRKRYLLGYLQESGIVWITLIIITFIGYSYSFNGWVNGFHYSLTLDNSISRNSYSFDKNQVANLVAELNEVQDILYMDEDSLYFYLSNGVLKNGAIYYRALKGSPELDKWITNNPDITYLVALNPIEKLPLHSNAHIELMGGERLRVNNENSLLLSDYELFLDNPTQRDITLAIEYLNNDEKEIQVIEVPANSADWHRISDDEKIEVEWFVVTSREGRQILNLQGIRQKRDQEHQWPWNSGISLNYWDSNIQEKPFVVNFSTSRLDASLELVLNVIDDTGSTVLLKVGED